MSVPHVPTRPRPHPPRPPQLQRLRLLLGRAFGAAHSADASLMVARWPVSARCSKQCLNGCCAAPNAGVKCWPNAGHNQLQGLLLAEPGAVGQALGRLGSLLKPLPKHKLVAAVMQ